MQLKNGDGVLDEVFQLASVYDGAYVSSHPMMSTSSRKPSKSKGSKSNTRSKSSSGNDEGWSEWEWDARYRREWRSRQKSNGEWEYDYYTPEENTPRTPNPEGGNILDRIDEDPQDNPQYSQYPLSNSPPGRGQLSTSSPSSGGFNLGSGQLSSLSHDVGRLRMDSSVAQDDTADYGGGAQSMVNSRDIPTTGSQRGLPGTAQYWDPLATQGLSYSTSLPTHTTQPNPSLYSQPGPTNITYSDRPAQSSEDPTILPSKQTKPGSVESDRCITDSSPTQALHKDFKVHLAKEFKFGRVFKILWTEPKGQGMPTKGTDRIEGVTFQTTYKEEVYTSVRRFVIIKVKDGHCLCLPILTYQGQATTKRGVKAQDHAIIYTEEKGKKTKRPKEAEGEEKLKKKAIRIVSSSAREQLDKLSRLNYAKIYTVEYNVKVHFIGQVHEKSIKYLARDYNAMHLPIPEEADVEFSEDSEDA